MRPGSPHTGPKTARIGGICRPARFPGCWKVTRSRVLSLRLAPREPHRNPGKPCIQISRKLAPSKTGGIWKHADFQIGQGPTLRRVVPEAVRKATPARTAPPRLEERAAPHGRPVACKRPSSTRPMKTGRSSGKSARAPPAQAGGEGTARPRCQRLAPPKLEAGPRCRWSTEVHQNAPRAGAELQKSARAPHAQARNRPKGPSRADQQVAPENDEAEEAIAAHKGTKVQGASFGEFHNPHGLLLHTY